jgi:hypothetical protein
LYLRLAKADARYEFKCGERTGGEVGASHRRHKMGYGQSSYMIELGRDEAGAEN